MFQVCKHDIMLPFEQEHSEDEQYTETASDFRDSSDHLSLFHRQPSRCSPENISCLIQREYIHVHLKMHTFILNNIIKVFICKLKVNYIYIFQMYKYIRISLNWNEDKSESVSHIYTQHQSNFGPS